jgi:hypothetical protein
MIKSDYQPLRNVTSFFVEGGRVSNPSQKDGKDAYEHGKEAGRPQEAP